MNRINAFEIMCYLITAIFLRDVFQKRRKDEFLLFLAACLAGFALELLAVRVTDIYHYSNDFYISIGFAPYQFPSFGGLMWGGLNVCGLRLAEKLGMNEIMTGLVTGWLVVSMDLLLDVAAIRLDGGFWVWEGRAITPDITHHMFMSVIWVNFLGYMFETPVIVYVFLKLKKKLSSMGYGKQLLYVPLITLAGIAAVAAGSGAALGLNMVTDEWFACIAFVILWFFVLVKMIQALYHAGVKLSMPDKDDLCVLVYWMAMYVYSLAGLVHLGIAKDKPFYFIFGILLCAGTAALCIIKRKEAHHD